jgi:predicted nucleic acid-binding protein
MSDELFVDTNILLYAHDQDAGARQQRARDLIRELWEAGRRPALSVQVLQELYVNLTRKQVTPAVAREVVRQYMHWHVLDNTPQLTLEGSRLSERWQLSFWDGLIVAAAQAVGARILWSEDFQDGQRFGGVTVRNPLR